MNKRLFCALCCVGVAGYASENETLEYLPRNRGEVAPVVQQFASLKEMSRYLDETRSFLDRWDNLKVDVAASLPLLLRFYTRRLELKLLDEPSEEEESELTRSNSDIQTLERKAREWLTPWDDALCWSVYAERLIKLKNALQKVSTGETSNQAS